MADKENKTFKEKLSFFWKYNKVHVFIWAIGLIFLGIFLFQQISSPVLLFHSMFLNTDNKEENITEDLSADFLKTYNVDPTSGIVIMEDSFSYYPGNDEKSKENFDSSEYILVEKDKASLDIIVGPLSAVKDIAYNNMFQDLESILTDEELSLCREHYLYVDQEVINELSAAYEADKDVSSIEIPDCKNPDEMNNAIPVMIDVSHCTKLASLYNLDEQSEPIVLAIMTDAPDKDLTLKFIQYLMK